MNPLHSLDIHRGVVIPPEDVEKFQTDPLAHTNSRFAHAKNVGRFFYGDFLPSGNIQMAAGQWTLSKMKKDGRGDPFVISIRLNDQILTQVPPGSVNFADGWFGYKNELPVASILELQRLHAERQASEVTIKPELLNGDAYTILRPKIYRLLVDPNIHREALSYANIRGLELIGEIV